MDSSPLSQPGAADPGSENPASADSEAGDLGDVPAVERDRLLVAAWRSGDRKSGERLLELYHRYFLSLCWRYGIGNEEEQLDQYQEVLIRLLKALPKLELQSSFAGYLRRVFHTAFRQTRSRVKPVAIDEEALPGESEGLRPVEQQELLAAIDECRARLDHREAVVVQRRLIEEISYQEIAQELGLSLGNLHVIYHRARTKMKSCLEKKGFEV